MPEIGARRLKNGPGRSSYHDEYRPDAVPWKRFVRWGLVEAGWKLGVPVGEGWVRMYGEGLNYPYVEHGQIKGATRG